jgi:4-aminobutyrate aminotransferase / (S)-3-amino-2-methylpropionate transaminase
MIVDEV